MSQWKMMDKIVDGTLMILLFATLRMEVWSLAIWEPTQAPVQQVTNAYADKITSVPKHLVDKGKGTVTMTLNVKDHLFVDTWFAWTVQ